MNPIAADSFNVKKELLCNFCIVTHYGTVIIRNLFLQEKLGAEILELEASAREKRHQKKEKEKLLDRNKALARQSAER